MLYNSDIVIALKDDDSGSIKNAKLYLEKELNEGDCAWLKRILVTIQENKNEWPMEIYVTNILEDKLTREKNVKNFRLYELADSDNETAKTKLSNDIDLLNKFSAEDLTKVIWEVFVDY